MPDHESYMADLLHRFLKDGLAAEEQSVLNQWLASAEANQQLLRRVMNKRKLKQQLVKYHRIDAKAAYGRLQMRRPELKTGGPEVAGNGAGAERATGMGESAGLLQRRENGKFFGRMRNGGRGRYFGRMRSGGDGKSVGMMRREGLGK